jgi:uncharacterized OsmC-like protein
MVSPRKQRWAELTERYRREPEAAVAEMGAVCSSDPSDPKRWSVKGTPGSTVELQMGNHPALGGDGSAPCPGEVLSMALASCMYESVRVIAGLMKVRLDAINVEVVNRGDLRGFFGLSDAPPPPDIGFSMRVEVVPTAGEDPRTIADLLAAAEQSSAVLNVMRSGVPVAVTTTPCATDAASMDSA